MERTFKTVNEAFYGLVRGVSNGQIPTIQTASRNGTVLQVPEPVTITYKEPCKRVLFNTVRDANPFFHVFESLWMLAGHNDVEPLTRYVKRMSEYSDDGQTFNGAYGYRWRSSMFGDQLRMLSDHLKKNPESRRAVLQMWNVKDDLLKIEESKDVCCNTAVYFSVNNGQLEMTVTNRSNDMIWGMLGANAVHFSFLQEYLAARIGVAVGRYHQFSNNLHIYTNSNSGWNPEELLSYYGEVDHREGGVQFSYPTHFPLVKDPEVFDDEVKEFVRCRDHQVRKWEEPFLQFVASPMMWIYELHKRRDYESAERVLATIEAQDWQSACRNWIGKRKENFNGKNG